MIEYLVGIHVMQLRKRESNNIEWDLGLCLCMCWVGLAASPIYESQIRVAKAITNCCLWEFIIKTRFWIFHLFFFFFWEINKFICTSIQFILIFKNLIVFFLAQTTKYAAREYCNLSSRYVTSFLCVYYFYFLVIIIFFFFLTRYI